MNMIEHSNEEIENFVDCLDTDEVRVLVELFRKVDRLQIKDGAPVWDEAEMDLIGRVQNFLTTDQNDSVDEEQVMISTPGLPGVQVPLN